MLGGPSRGPQWLRRRPGARGTWRQMLWGPKKPLPQPRPEGPPRAPPHWVIPYLMKDRNPHRFRQQSQTLVRVHGGRGWTGGGCSHLSRVPKKGPHARTARATVPGQKQNIVCGRTQGKGAVTPQETGPDLPVFEGLLQSRGLAVACLRDRGCGSNSSGRCILA